MVYLQNMKVVQICHLLLRIEKKMDTLDMAGPDEY